MADITPIRPSLDPDAVAQEANVLGVGLVWPKAWADICVLAPSDFCHPMHRSIYEAMREVAAAGRPIDRLTVAEQMRAAGTFDRLRAAHGEHYLEQLTSEVVTWENVRWYVNNLAQRARERELRASLVNAAGLEPDALVEAAKRAVDRYHERATVSEGLPVVRSSDVPDPGPTRWLVENLWIAGGVGFIAGEPKTRKSFLSLAMAIAVASGRKLLQRFQARRAPVVMFNAEDRQAETRRRLERMCIAEGVCLSDLEIYLVDVHGLRLTDAAQMRALDATVGRIKPGLVVLDPLRNLFDGDEDKSEAVTAALNPLRLLQRRHDTAVAVVHHMTKPNELKRRAGQRMRGSGALHGWGDCNIYVELKGEVSAVEVEQRYADACEPFGWQLRDQTTPDGDALWCEPCAIPAQRQSGEQEKAAHATNEALVLRTIRSASEPLSAGHIAQQLKMRRSDVFAALNVLAETNAIEQVNRQIVDKLGRSRAVSGWVQRGAN